MASFTCHVLGGTKRLRLERIVRPHLRHCKPYRLKCSKNALWVSQIIKGDATTRMTRAASPKDVVAWRYLLPTHAISEAPAYVFHANHKAKPVATRAQINAANELLWIARLIMCGLTPELSRAVSGAATCASVANAHRRRNETASA